MDKKQLINLLETEEDTNILADKILALNNKIERSILIFIAGSYVLYDPNTNLLCILN
jgi:hypothetical protein